ncbi:hypothetical protein Hesp01_00040 [Herbidospora sp. NBRC 101105]|nr:hypothetical protein Hesp01_00040 [Herbidospora sp. NBRC 101105]
MSRYVTITESETPPRAFPAPDHRAIVRALSARFPHWSIWYGSATGHYWGLRRFDDGRIGFIEALSPQEFVRQATTGY